MKGTRSAQGGGHPSISADSPESEEAIGNSIGLRNFIKKIKRDPTPDPERLDP